MRPTHLAPSSFAFLVGALLLPSPPSLGQEGGRVAFVLGLNTFEHLSPQAQLKVAASDAIGMAETLESLDPPFRVTLLTERDEKKTWGRDEIWQELEEWIEEARGAECALVYVASHGIEFHGQNYLLAGDTKIETVSEGIETMKRRLARTSIALQELMDELDGTQASVKVVILDACRDNPLQAIDVRGTRTILGSRGGLAPVSAPGGSLISFSADAGQQANDGLYTGVLRKFMAEPGMTLQEVFAATREEVVRESTLRSQSGKGVRHEPAEYTKLNVAGTRFTFTKGASAPVNAPDSRDDAEMKKLRSEIAELRKALESAEGNAGLLDRLQRELKKAQEKLTQPPPVPSAPAPTTPGSVTPGTMSRTDPPSLSSHPAAKPVRDPLAEAGRRILETYKSSLVVVTVNQTVVGSGKSSSSETSRRTLGVTVRSDGLLIVSNSAIDASIPEAPKTEAGADVTPNGGAGATSRIGKIEISYGDASVRTGKLIGRSTGADIAFILPDSPPKTGHVSLDGESEARVGQDVVGVSRSSSAFGYMPTVIIGSVVGLFRGELGCFISDAGKAQGVPVFDTDGNFLGITVQRMVDGNASGVLGILTVQQLRKESERLSLRL